MATISALRSDRALVPVTRPSRAKAAAAPVVEPVPVADGRSKTFRKRMRRQAVAAAGIGLVAAVLTTLSLSHLAHGIRIVTSAEAWQSWAFAIGIDIAMIAAELAMIFAATPTVRKTIAVYGNPLVIGTLASSAIMNAFAFGANCGGYLLAAAIAFGVSIPLIIYALTRMGAALYLDGDR